MNTNRNDSSDKVGLLIVLGFFLFGVFVLIPLFPPFGILWCGLLGGSMAAIAKRRKEGKGTSSSSFPTGTDWESIRRSGREAKIKYLRHVKAEDMAEQPFHSHDPVSYSYDDCAVEKRLEQLEVLKKAGLLDDSEYHTRRQEILSMQ